MYFFMWLLGVVCGFILFELIKSYVLYTSFRRMEAQLLFIAASLVQYKYHAIKIIEIAYSSDENKNEECQNVIAKIHEKFDSYANSWINLLKQNLPYNTEYNDWKSAIHYIEQLITKNQLR